MTKPTYEVSLKIFSNDTSQVDAKEMI